MRRKIRGLERFARDVRGSAAAEFAIVATVLVYMMLNVVDLGMYVYARMELENAAQAAAEHAYSSCEGTTTYDVTRNCASIATAITNAAHNTSLGSNVSAAIGSTGEAWYCSNGSGGLTKATESMTAGSQPQLCSLNGVLLNISNDGDYLPVTATYTYTPVFPGASVTSLLTTSMTKTVWIRVA